MQIRYSGKYLTERKPIETDHRIFVFHRFPYGDTTNNRAYEKILENIPNAYCDGWTIFLPEDFDREIISTLKEFFKADNDFYPDNIQRIDYVNDKVHKLTQIYEYKQPVDYDDEDDY